MPGRPVVREMIGPEPVSTCPGCAASFAAIPRRELRRVTLPCRCHRGQDTFELRCPSCRQLVVLHALPTGVLSVLPDQHGALTSLRDLGREEVADRGRFDDRDR